MSVDDVQFDSSPTVVCRGAPIMLWPIISRPIIGRLPIVYFRTHLRSIKIIL